MASAGAVKKERNAGERCLRQEKGWIGSFRRQLNGQHLLWNNMETNDKRNIAATPHTKEHYEIKNERKTNPSSELYIERVCQTLKPNK